MKRSLLLMGFWILLGVTIAIVRSEPDQEG